jgi:hypothetical protein
VRDSVPLEPRIEEGGVIPLHAHSYDHVAMITQGVFAVTEITKAGETKEYIAAAKGEGRAGRHRLPSDHSGVA